jgi:hypothetical protein
LPHSHARRRPHGCAGHAARRRVPPLLRKAKIARRRESVMTATATLRGLTLARRATGNGGLSVAIRGRQYQRRRRAGRGWRVLQARSAQSAHRGRGGAGRCRSNSAFSISDICG